MDLPDLTPMTYRQRAERLADEAVRALRQNRLDDATALAAVASAHATIASSEDIVETPAGIPLSVTKNPRVKAVATFLRRRPNRPVSNAEIKKAFGYNDAEAGNALRDAAALGLAIKLGHGVWQAT